VIPSECTVTLSSTRRTICFWNAGERPGDDGDPRYVLVCGEGRLNAFRILGETHIPALVVDVTDEDAFIMSLAENIARRGYRPLEILADIEVLRKRGYERAVCHGGQAECAEAGPRTFAQICMTPVGEANAELRRARVTDHPWDA